MRRGGAVDGHALVGAELDGLAAVVAAELARPASSRDPDAVVAALGRIEALRPRFSRSLRALEAALEAGGMTLADRRALRRVTQAARFQAGRWSAVVACVRAQLAGDRRLLMPPRPMADPAAAQLAVSDAAFLAMLAMANPNDQAPEAKAHGCYPDIRLRPSRFLELAHAAFRVALARRRPGPLSFIDVGCGGGGKVLLAAGFFDRADGLEFDPGYARAARDLLAATVPGRCAVIEGDALRFDGYGDYDVVYFYQPMTDWAKLGELEERIVGQVRPGTVLIAPYPRFQQRSDEFGCPQVARGVNIAGVSPAAADALRDEAERIGPAVVRGREPDARCGFWAPVVAASCANGYDPMC